MADIFLSYSRADHDIVSNVVTAIEAEGWTVWWDTGLRAGEQWDEVIEREIKAARCVMVVWSPLSVTRYWVRVEANFGRDRNILVPVAVEGAEPPLGFTLIQAANLTGWDGDASAPVMRGVVEAVREKLGRAQGPVPDLPVETGAARISNRVFVPPQPYAVASAERDTLRSAKTANDVTLTAVRNRVTARAEELEQEVAAFLRPYANRDNRDLVNNIDKRDRLRMLIYKLKDLEHLNNILDWPVKFGPNTHFLQALNYYIEELFDMMIETLQVLVERTDVPVPTDLKIRSQYWIAYEQINIGEFSKAELSFESAISTAEQSRASIERILELKRLRIESMLFNTKSYRAAYLIDDIDDIIGQWRKFSD